MSSTNVVKVEPTRVINIFITDTPARLRRYSGNSKPRRARTTVNHISKIVKYIETKTLARVFIITISQSEFRQTIR